MQKTVLTFGFIAGAILSITLIVSAPYMETAGYPGMVVGYSSMVLAFLLVYFGIRSYREHQPGGAISFGRALRVGAAISAIACVCYVATWEVIYFGFNPGFADKYAAHQIDQARAEGASPAALEQRRQEMERFKVMYRNPLANIALTFLEPLPVALLMTLASAALLRRREPAPA